MPNAAPGESSPAASTPLRADVIESLLQAAPLDGRARVERVREATDLSVVHGGAVFDVNIPVASCKDANLKRTVRIRLRREVGGGCGIAVAARVGGEVTEERVQLRLGDGALRVRCRFALQLVRIQLRAVLRDVDAREAE